MAAVIGALRAELSANVGKFVGEMKTAGGAVKSFGKTAGSVAATTGLLGAAVGGLGLLAFVSIMGVAAKQVKLTGDSMATTGKEAVVLADVGAGAFAMIGEAGTSAAQWIGDAWEAASGRVVGSAEEQASGVQKAFGATLHFLAEAFNWVVGAISGMVLATYSIFKGLGPAIADIFVGAMNASIRAVQAGVNAIINAVRVASGGLVDLAPVALKQVENSYAGAAGKLGWAVGFSFTEGMKASEGVAQKIGASLWDKAQEARDRRAKKPAKGRSGGKSEAEKEAERIERATATLDKALDKANRRIDRGLDDLRLPESVEKANALRAAIEDAAKTAQEAGVPMDQFTDRIAKMNARIQELETEGLAKEAQEFARAVAKSDREVREFARGGLAPLDAALQEVDDKFEGLRDGIKKQIEENQELAARVPEAAAALKTLEAQLEALTAAHTGARDAAKSQHEALQALADLEAQAAGNATASAIQDLRNARDGGPIGAAAKRAAELERELRDQRLGALTELKALEIQKAEAERVGDEESATRLTGLIDLQRQLYELTAATSAAQIMATERFDLALDDFLGGMSDELSDMVVDWEADIEGLRGVWKQFAKELFIKPFMDQVTAGAGGWLKNQMGQGGALGAGGGLQNIGKSIAGFFGNFAGMFAGGGTIGAGKWGIAGENGPEPVYSGSRPMQVMPTGSLGGRTQIINVSTPDANSFRRSRRQVGRAAQTLLGGQ